MMSNLLFPSFTPELIQVIEDVPPDQPITTNGILTFMDAFKHLCLVLVYFMLILGIHKN